MDELIFGLHAVKSALNYCSDSRSDNRDKSEEQTIRELFVDRSRKDNRINAIIELAKKNR